MPIKSYKDLRVWQMSMQLVKSVYAVTATLPASERYGLVSQMQRAATSIPSNIAEGSKRGSRADFRQFVRIALGSAAELETQLLLIGDLYPQTQSEELLMVVEDVQKMLSSLSARLGQPINDARKTVN